MPDNENSPDTRSTLEPQAVLQPLRDQHTGAELVIRTPAPNSSAPTIPVCSVVTAAP